MRHPDEPFAMKPDEEPPRAPVIAAPKRKDFPDYPAWRKAMVEYLASLPERTPEGELDGPNVPFGFQRF